MFRYKVNVLSLLKQAGFNSTRILKENLLSQSAMQDLRDGKVVGIKSLDKICSMLNMQPGELIEYIKSDDVKQ